MKNKLILLASIIVFFGWVGLLLDTLLMPGSITHFFESIKGESQGSEVMVSEVDSAVKSRQTKAIKKLQGEFLDPSGSLRVSPNQPKKAIKVAVASVHESTQLPKVNSELAKSVEEKMGINNEVNVTVDPLEDRMNRVKALVAESVNKDQAVLKDLTSKKSKLMTVVDEIDRQTNALTVRLSKLQRIKKFFRIRREVMQAVQRKTNPVPVATVKSAVSKFNEMFYEEQVQLDENKNTIKLTLEGASLLAIDKGPLRISNMPAKKFSRVVRSIKKNRFNVERIVIKKDKRLSSNYAKILSSYLKKQYGWDTVVIQVDENLGAQVQVFVTKPGALNNASEKKVARK